MTTFANKQPPSSSQQNNERKGVASRLVASPTLDLPKGGGAIRGMGEKFAANPVTGTGSMSVPVYLSPSRSDFSPELSLSYDSGSGNGIFGMGWQLSLPSITRKTDKGLPRYLDHKESDVFILSDAEDLVPSLKLDNGEWVPDTSPIIDGYEIKRYRPRVEGLFARIERWTNTNTRVSHWRVISKDNVTSIYGLDDNSRISDPKSGSSNPRIFKWLISMSFDNKGNVICYEYKGEDGVGVPSKVYEKNREINANRYIKRIKYGNRTPFTPSSVPVSPLSGDLINDFMFEAVFDYGEHDDNTPLPTKSWDCRPDPFSNYRSGFEIRTYRLCHRILMFHHFPEEAEVGVDCLVRATKIFYCENEPNANCAAYSFVTSIVQSGYKRKSGGDSGYDEKSLPPTEFEYSKPEIDTRVRHIDEDELGRIRFSKNGPSAEWVDLYGEGLTGILVREQNGWYYKRNVSPYKAATKGIKTPGFERNRPVTLVPSLAAGKQLQFMDLAGDGRPDIVSLGPPVSGFYEVSEDEKIDKFKTLRNVPNIDWNQNGDGGQFVSHRLKQKSPKQIALYGIENLYY